jgi:hypothetical protein
LKNILKFNFLSFPLQSFNGLCLINRNMNRAFLILPKDFWGFFVKCFSGNRIIILNFTDKILQEIMTLQLIKDGKKYM